MKGTVFVASPTNHFEIPCRLNRFISYTEINIQQIVSFVFIFKKNNVFINKNMYVERSSVSLYIVTETQAVTVLKSISSEV